MKQDFDNNSIESCSNGILFDHTYYGSTILEDFNLSVIGNNVFLKIGTGVC